MHFINFVAAILVGLTNNPTANAELTAITTSTSTSTSTKIITLSEVTSTTRIGKHIDAADVAVTHTHSDKPQSTEARSNIDNICFPRDAETGQYDLSYPCPIANFIMEECTYGADVARSILNGTFPRKESASKKEAMKQHPKAQQLCACNSHMLEFWVGCAECYVAHGLHVVNVEGVEAAGSSYCAVGTTPTAGVLQAVRNTLRKIMPIHHKQAVGQDPLNGSKAVSLYFTALVTGPAATHIPDFTNAAGSTTLSLKPLQSKVTPTGDALGTGVTPCATSGSYATIRTKANPSATVDAGNGAGRRGAAVAGVFGVAAVVVFL